MWPNFSLYVIVSSFSLIFACKPKTISAVKGDEVDVPIAKVAGRTAHRIEPEKRPATVLLDVKVSIGVGTCSGTFISTKHIITAAHCLVSEAITYNGTAPIKIYKDANVQVDKLSDYNDLSKI